MRRPMDDVQLAERMFEAYGNSAGWTAVNGNIIPIWSLAGPLVREHWTRAAAAARAALRDDVSRETSSGEGA